MEMELVIEIIKILSGVVAILSILVVFYRLKQIERALQSSAQNSLYSQSFEIRKFVGTNPEIFKYIYDHEEFEGNIKNENDIKAKMAALMYLSYLENLVTQRNNLSKKDRLNWTNNFVIDSLKKSPIMMKILEDNEKIYSNELMNFLKEVKENK